MIPPMEPSLSSSPASKEASAVTSATLATAITEAATALGFGAVGFIKVADLEQHPDWLAARDGLNQWLQAGYHATMDWIPRYADERTQPEAILPTVKTIVCVALNYHQAEADINHTQALKVAEYAWGKDYHKLIRKRLQKLLTQIQQWVPGCTGRPVTDSAPLLEKPLAALAGIGWQGKNSLLLNPQLGSTFFLGELLLDFEFPIPPPAPMDNMCGTCTRCLDACPTDAFPQPGVLDSNKCIATWTIETAAETPIPDEIAHNQHGWVFGCDICQQVCPWNISFARPTNDPAFVPRPASQSPNTEQLHHMTEAEFNRIYANSPLRRTGLARLQATVKQQSLIENESQSRTGLEY